MRRHAVDHRGRCRLRRAPARRPAAGAAARRRRARRARAASRWARSAPGRAAWRGRWRGRPRPPSAASSTAASASHAHLALLADQQRVQLQVVVRDAGLVGEGQALQRLAQPADDFHRRRPRLRRQPLAERDAQRAVDGDVGPVVLHADLDDVRQVRVVQPRGLLHLAQAQLQRGGVGRLHARQRQHHLLAEARVEGQPGHRARRSCPAAGAARSGRRRGSGWSGRRQWRAWQAWPSGVAIDVDPIGSDAAGRRSEDQRAKRRLFVRFGTPAHSRAGRGCRRSGRFDQPPVAGDEGAAHRARRAAPACTAAR